MKLRMGLTSAICLFTTNSEEVEGRPLFNRFAKADSMKAVSPPLSRDYTPLSDHIDLDESQMSYGTKSSTFGDSNFVSNDFVSCDNNDKSSEVNTNDFASSDSSVKSSEPKSNDSTSCESTSSVSTSESEDKIESNVGTPIQEPIIVQDLPSFSCNSSDKNENTSRTSCNKNGYFNKKASHFRKNASSVFKLCFVCGSSTHLIKDCDFYKKQMANNRVNILLLEHNPYPTGKPNGLQPSFSYWLGKIGLFHFLLIEDLLHQYLLEYHIQMLKIRIFDSGCFRSMTGKFDGKADEGYIVGYSTSNRAYRVYNVPNKRVEETMNLRYLKEKHNVQGLGNEWYFNLDYLTDTLGYKRDKANQSAGTQEASTNPTGTQDADSDSECDEQVIIIPSYPSHNIQEAESKDTSGDEVDDSPLDSCCIPL
ncbi:hypothetical protein Tco_0268799 [Tanacetum coccineum]